MTPLAANASSAARATTILLLLSFLGPLLQLLAGCAFLRVLRRRRDAGRIRSCFDKPVLSAVEGLSTNGKSSVFSILPPFALSLSKGELSQGSDRNLLSRGSCSMLCVAVLREVSLDLSLDYRAREELWVQTRP
jgi:hypothetical protein